MVELSVPLDTVRYLIVTARAYDAQVADTDPDSGSNPTDDESLDVLEAGPDDPVQQELEGALESLSVDQVIDLVTLTWIGRGDFTAEQWDEARLEAQRTPQRRRAPDYLLSEPLLGDYLEEGLAALGIEEDDPTTMEDDDPYA